MATATKDSRTAPKTVVDINSDSGPDSESSYDGDRRIRPQLLVFQRVNTVLKPLTAGVSADDDAWPGFLLNDAVVYLPDGTTMVSLFEATSKGPLIVTGTLEFEENDPALTRLTRAKHKNATIVLDGVFEFSFGVRPGSPPPPPRPGQKIVLKKPAPNEHAVLWAGARKYGWFEISPAEAFIPIYTKMIEFVQAYFGLQSIYQKKRSYKLPIEQVLSELGFLGGGGLRRHVIEDQLKNNARYFFEQMGKAKEREVVDWVNTVFYNWLAASCPDVWVEYKKSQGKNSVKPPTLIPSISIVSPNDPPLSDRREPKYNTEQPSGAQLDVRTIDSNLVKSNAEWIIYVMEYMVQGKGSRGSLTCAKLWNEMYREFSLRYPPWAKEMVMLHASEVLELLDSTWNDTGIYTELASFIPLPPPIDAKVRDLVRKVSLKPRRRQSFIHAQADAKRKGLPAPVVDPNYQRNKPQMSRSASSTPAAGPSNHKRISLRDKTADTSGKVAIRQREEAKREAITSGEGVIAKGLKRVPFPNAGQHSGKKSTLHPAGLKRSRDLETVDDDDSEAPRVLQGPELIAELAQSYPRFKRRRLSRPPGESGSDESRPSTSSSNASDDAPIKFSFTIKPLHQLEPNTEDNAWACNLWEGKKCNKVIYDLDSVEASCEYDDHVQDHVELLHKFWANEAKEKALLKQENANNAIALVIKEATKTGHGVNALVDFMKSKGTDDRLAEEEERQVINGKKVPLPIKRYRY